MLEPLVQLPMLSNKTIKLLFSKPMLKPTLILWALT
jgi:hypothetical protein